MAVACTASALCVPMSVSATGLLSELESNNTRATAAEITTANIYQGNISSSSDVDYYKFVPNITGYVNITLASLQGSDCNFRIYNSSGSLMHTAASYGFGAGERACLNATKGKTYYIEVYRGNSSGTNSKYKLYVAPSMPKNGAWYSQLSGKVTSEEEWNTYRLNEVYFNQDGYKKFFIDNVYGKGAVADYMGDGCAITCASMVLRNMNALTSSNYTDFRTGYYGKCYADPYIVAMANIGTTSAPTWQSEESKYGYTSSKNPVYMRTDSWSQIATAFGKKATFHSNPTWSKAVELVSSYPQGVIVRFQKTKGENGTDYTSHYVVLAKSGDGYLVYDPGTAQTGKGKGVSWSNAYVNTTMKFTQLKVTEIITIS